MENCKEPVSLRIGRLYNSILARSGPMQRNARMKMSQDALLDAFILLYEECSKECFKRDPRVCSFISKYRTLVHEIKSLRVNLNDFEIHHVIGRGYFGDVKIVKEKQTNDFYAMKTIKKSETAFSACTVLFEEERDIMCTATSNWITTLQYSFQDNDNLYFIMEYNAGGDLLSLLKKNNGRFSSDTARFYLAETALAIRALHQMGYVHRDIKPENILLDRCGHIKLGDFGCSAKLSSVGLVTQPMPMGTPQYIAPEIMSALEFGGGDKNKKQCYGIECDYWSLGVVAYELVVGRMPFVGNQLKSVYYNIMKQRKQLKYPEDVIVPESLRDLISKLLEEQSVRLKHDGVIRHSFFRGVNWANIHNEVPPIVPPPTTENEVSNSIPEYPKKILLRGEMKDNRRDFSGKNLPFIGFSYSGSNDSDKNLSNESSDSNSDKKNPALESLLAVARRENKNLISKLVEAEFGKSEEVENLEKKLEEKIKLLEICELERNDFQRELAKLRAEYSNVHRILELERQDRREVEANALKLIADTKMKIQRDITNQMRLLNAKIEELNDKLTEAHTVNNELTSKNDRIKAELIVANNEIEILKKLEADFKNKLTEAREFKRKSVVGLESRLEKMANDNQTQANNLQQKLNEETAAKSELEKRLKEMETTLLTKESQYKQDKKDLDDLISKLEMKINTQNSEISSLQAQLNEKPDVALLEEKLRQEKNECEKLRNKVSAMEYELTHATHSFVNHESAMLAHQEAVVVLEKELREASEQKIRLQKKLQKTKETEEENRQKLSNLEVVVDRLEQGVLKLEAENAKLKQQVVEHAQPILPEAETRYREKISILEDQIAKLQSQLEKLKETCVLEKETLRTTQAALWKTEKQLSDAKIDIRIAERESKTFEDLVAKLQSDIKKLNEKLTEAEQESLKKVMAEREKLDKIFLEKADLNSEINQKELEIKTLKAQLQEVEELKELAKQVKKDYNELDQKYKVLEKQTDYLKEEKEKAKEYCQSLEMEKLKMETAAEELKHKICSLELNNQVLKETGAMLDEQLEDYDKFTTTQTHKIEGLTKEKLELEKEVENIQNELRSCRQNLNEEKSLRIRAEQKAQFLEVEIKGREESLKKAVNDLANRNAVVEDLKAELANCKEALEVLELELGLSKQKYESLNDEFLWLKKETSSYLTNLYSLRESNYKLTQDLEEKTQALEALQERIGELQNVISDLEAFHKQREVKDEATKQQQSKLISFLQEKLDDARKKKMTLTDVIFGSRNKENGVTSPPSKTEGLKRCKGSSKNLLVSPKTKEAISELVKSPSSQSYFQRQSSMQRMYHNIPHRFKSQVMTRNGMCGSCHSPVSRGTQGSSCTHCGIQAHPKCALTVPKTCGLPQGLAKHYAQSVVKTDEEKTESTNTEASTVEGWIKTLNSIKTSWEKRYARLEGNKILIFENRPNEKQVPPISILNLCPSDTQVIVGEGIEPDEVPNTAKSNIPYIIKIVQIPTNACWPQETHYLMILASPDKPKWLAALNGIILNSNAVEKSQKYSGTIVHSFPKENNLNFTCASQINEKIILLGAEEGLFSLRTNTPSAEPVHIKGPVKIRQLTLVPHIGVALMIGTLNKRLLTCDYRALVSNAEAASCTNPSICVKDVNPEVVDEDCFMFAVSPNIEGCVYLVVATLNKLSLLKWCMGSSEFQKMRVMETLHRCSCALYTKHSVIVGCDKFFEIKLQNLYVQEFLDPSVKSLAFWRVGSFPIKIFEITNNDYLLCFNEFGVFVNENGRKTQCDLKWSKVPCDFAFSKPFLYVVHTFSVEVIRVPYLDPKSADDSICTSSTSTVSDSIHINLSNPRYLGDAKVPGGIYLLVSTNSGVDLVILEGKNLYKDDLGSCSSLNSVADESSRGRPEGDEFSFTSSIVQSLKDVGCSTPRHSDEESCSTYTISDAGNNQKRVTFVQEKAF